MFLVHEKDALMRAQLHAATDVITGHGVGLSGASLGVLNMLPYVHAFDTKTGMPYVCDPYKKAPDDKFDNRWKMVVPPCPDFKKCLFPWNEGGLLVGVGGTAYIEFVVLLRDHFYRNSTVKNELFLSTHVNNGFRLSYLLNCSDIIVFVRFSFNCF